MVSKARKVCQLLNSVSSRILPAPETVQKHFWSCFHNHVVLSDFAVYDTSIIMLSDLLPSLGSSSLPIHGSAYDTIAYDTIMLLFFRPDLWFCLHCQYIGSDHNIHALSAQNSGLCCLRYNNSVAVLSDLCFCFGCLNYQSIGSDTSA